MSQLKALMAGKKMEARLEHPFAKYVGNQLSCSLCAVPIKLTLFSAHLLTLVHRNNLKRRTVEQEKVRAALSLKRRREEEAEEIRNLKLKKVEIDKEDDNNLNEEEDDEWNSFEASLLNQSTQQSNIKTSETATIFAAPVEYEFGAVKVLGEGEEETQDEEEYESEEARIERIAQEAAIFESEEILERITSEERDQMEADAKVTALKLRLERIREARKKK